MRPAPWILSALSGLAMLTGATLAPADELNTPPAPAASSADHPARGMSMEKVEATFGAPAQRLPAVGQPPITRWEYPGFVVYFENSTVLHTVVAAG